jgi:acetoacetyl-CoA synthetase
LIEITFTNQFEHQSERVNASRNRETYMSKTIWTPTDRRIAKSEILDFGNFFGKALGRPVMESRTLARAALERPELFWNAIWDYFEILGDKGDAPWMTGGEMISTRFFPNARLNFAENLMQLGDQRDPGSTALGFGVKTK